MPAKKTTTNPAAAVLIRHRLKEPQNAAKLQGFGECVLEEWEALAPALAPATYEQVCDETYEFSGLYDEPEVNHALGYLGAVADRYGVKPHELLAAIDEQRQHAGRKVEEVA